MAEVRTIKRHGNSYAPKFTKHPGRIYDAGRDTDRLIAEGLVEAVEPPPAGAVQTDDDGQE